MVTALSISVSVQQQYLNIVSKGNLLFLMRSLSVGTLFLIGVIVRPEVDCCSLQARPKTLDFEPHIVLIVGIAL
jgi:hypothetical protein